MFDGERNIFDNDLVIDLKDENGNSMIEAAIVVPITLFMIATIIMLGFYHYQVTLLQTIADETATNIARTYPYIIKPTPNIINPDTKKDLIGKDPITGFIGKKELEDRGFIESSYWVMGDIGIGASSKNENAKDETNKLVKHFMKKRRFLAAQGDMKIETKIQHSELVLFQNEVSVTVSEEYYIPFAQFLGVNNSVLKVSKSSKAICSDMMSVRGYYQAVDEVADFFGSTEIAKLVKNIADIINSFFKAEGNIIEILFGNKG